MKTGIYTLLALSTAGVLSSVSVSSASTLGRDNATSSPYADGWQTGDNGGTGFLAWTLTNNNDNATNFAGNFIGDSTANNSGIGNVNTGTSSFGTYANPNGAFANSDRSFAGGALTVGQTFSLNLAVNFRNGGKGLNLYTGSTQAFNFNVGSVGGTEGYYYTVGAGAAVNTGFAYATDSVFTLAYTQQSATNGLFTITRTSAGTPTANGTINVPFASSGVDGFRIYNSNGTNSASDNLYFNNLAIVPEPSTWATMLLGVGGMAAVVLRRRPAVS